MNGDLIDFESIKHLKDFRGGWGFFGAGRGDNPAPEVG
jgi:hypothetical protein